MRKQAPIEMIHNYYEVSKYLDDAQKTNLKAALGLTDEDEKRIVGLENETEFLIMVYLLGWVKEITAIDEGASPLTNTKSTDFFIDTIAGKKLSVEVKSSQNDSISFGRKLVHEKKEYSDRQNRELYFAIKLAGHWMLFSGQYVITKNYKISIKQDFQNSELNEVFGERIFLFPKGLEIFSTYSKQKAGVGVNHPEYGSAVRIVLKTNKRKVLSITTANQRYLLLSFILENLHDVMSNQVQEIIELDKDRTLVLEKFSNDFNLLKLSAFLMAPIKHMIDTSTGKAYTFETFKETMKEKGSRHISRQEVLGTLTMLDSENYPIAMFIDNKSGYRLNDLYIESKDE
ncbi:hypothetical protein [uncultured Phascolarctobacterium sp.]|uniref:hypothetical protein n=1 Tax=uncultured Phascolarctobacterium sp. TaxID=512296 RepID=UPI0026341843|nr:hypothetical protein [uncultured Phascolarctobacterium sp.]